ncbi:thermonuclease family protein [Egicoccus sp. AB-alg6-2]|uniref:thermonuclease family protein n=1 Tax=Egicoccus sp. AB-alg6-2 TaxID=3242692 RepID=UPI00359E81E0
MARPTMPPPGGRISMLDRFWQRFGGLPTWARAVTWFLLWPALAAAKALGATSRTREFRYGTAAATLLLGGLVWSGVLASVFSDPPTETVAAEPAATKAGEEADEVASAVDEADTSAVELALLVEATCSEAVAAGDTMAGRTALREGAANAAQTTEFSAREIRQAAADACGDQIAALGAPEAAEKEPAEAAPAEEPDARAEVGETAWIVFNVVDGDTIDVRAQDGSEERVRIIGIDTPERGECGFGEAADALAALIGGREVELVPGARDDRDRYDRILRYVDVQGTDVGLAIIEAGLATARYDSRDGYGRHPREDVYVVAQAAAAPYACAVPTPKPSPSVTSKPAPVSPSPTATPSPTAEPPPPPPSGGPGSGSGGAWKNCAEAREAGAAPVHRGDPGYGKHLDRDDDGIGCE